jgi:hypothetical protein
MCATVPGAHIRCMHSILSFNWSVTVELGTDAQKAAWRRGSTSSLRWRRHLGSGCSLGFGQGTNYQAWWASGALGRGHSCGPRDWADRVRGSWVSWAERGRRPAGPATQWGGGRPFWAGGKG